MAQVDAMRFLSNVAQLFAPNIHDGQVFVAYLNEDNSFTIQVDNVLKPSGGSVLTSDATDEVAQRLITLQTQVSEFESYCRNIPALQTQIQALSGSTENEGTIDFDFAYVINEIAGLKADIMTLSSDVEYLVERVDEIQTTI